MIHPDATAQVGPYTLNDELQWEGPAGETLSFLKMNFNPQTIQMASSTVVWPLGRDIALAAAKYLGMVPEFHPTPQLPEGALP